MSKRRRFKVSGLANAAINSEFGLAESEIRHLKVLRLKIGAQIEVFDGQGRTWVAELLDDLGTLILREQLGDRRPEADPRPRLTLACAWPKGKRAVVLVEKCTELGVTEIVPLRCERLVVAKQASSEGIRRLERIAGESAKQSNRSHIPVLSNEQDFAALVKGRADDQLVILLDPSAEQSLTAILDQSVRPHAPPIQEIRLLVGPEGGFTDSEKQLARDAGVACALLGRHTLRVETAALAACAIAGEWIFRRGS